jgi:single-strand DNA-binding protein
MDLNTFACTGRLTKLPELHELPSGISVCKLRLAVNGMGRGQTTGYINVAAFGARGEAAARCLSKGSLVAVSGRLEFAEWDGEDLRRRRDYTVVGGVEFLGSRDREEQGSTGAPAEEAVVA